jgi:UDP-glucose 4-epimerase
MQDESIEWLGGIDVRPPQITDRFHFYNIDIRSPELATQLKENAIDTVVHLAWVFNPTHNPEIEYEVDVGGSRNVLNSIQTAQVPYLIYLSSTTSYGPHPDNPQLFDENFPRRGHWGYLYSKYKAEVDHIMVDFIQSNPQIRVFLTRAAIVLGPHTKNVVTQMTEMPVMFAVSGYDPPMQFLHEEDIQRLLIWAVKEQPVGIFNLAGHGTVLYSRLVELLRKPLLRLPSSLIYPSLNALWKMHMMPFPSSILDFIRYPWVGSIQKFLDSCKFEIRHSSEEALMAYARARWPGKY